MMYFAYGHTGAILPAISRMMLTFVFARSSLVIPGFLPMPDVMMTMLDPFASA